MNRKIYDCFCYFNEDMLLELRLEILWQHIDYFVIVESIYTISGKPKPLNFKLEKFEKYRSKIRYVVLESYPFELDDPWRNERFQRDYIKAGLWDAQSHDWIIISDLDEIPKPATISSFNPDLFLRGDFEQYAYSYYLNNRCSHKTGESDKDGQRPILWYGSKITTYKIYSEFFGGAQQTRQYKSSGIFRAVKRAWFKIYKVQVIREGGWHFTWVTSIDRIILKLESYAHQEYNKPEYKNPEVIHAKIAQGFDILNPSTMCVPQQLDSQFPQFLLQNQSKYAEWLLAVDTPTV